MHAHTHTQFQTKQVSSYLKDSGYDEDVVACQRKLKLSSVQGVPQLPDRPSPRRPPEDPPRPRALVVQERQHVLMGEEGDSEGLRPPCFSM